mmetsp:Transcript_69789/g.160411  ORF Transcript_69789/g.160411 Transcript_69789/m.160411 type:complete len:330 (-) Transcript_69789:971-1960(-)
MASPATLRGHREHFRSYWRLTKETYSCWTASAKESNLGSFPDLSTLFFQQLSCHSSTNAWSLSTRMDLGTKKCSFCNRAAPDCPRTTSTDPNKKCKYLLPLACISETSAVNLRKILSSADFHRVRLNISGGSRSLSMDFSVSLKFGCSISALLMMASNKAQERKASSKEWSCWASRRYVSEYVSRFGRTIGFADPLSTTSSSITGSTRNSGFPSTSALRFQCVITLSQRTFGLTSCTMRTVVINLCSNKLAWILSKSGSSSSSSISSKRLCRKMKAEISHSRIMCRTSMYSSNSSSLSWIRSRKENSSIRWMVHMRLMSGRINPSNKET